MPLVWPIKLLHITKLYSLWCPKLFSSYTILPPVNISLVHINKTYLWRFRTGKLNRSAMVMYKNSWCKRANNIYKRKQSQCKHFFDFLYKCVPTCSLQVVSIGLYFLSVSFSYSGVCFLQFIFNCMLGQYQSAHSFWTKF